jgi:hypothetical protein
MNLKNFRLKKILDYLSWRIHLDHFLTVNTATGQPSQCRGGEWTNSIAHDCIARVRIRHLDSLPVPRWVATWNATVPWVGHRRAAEVHKIQEYTVLKNEKKKTIPQFEFGTSAIAHMHFSNYTILACSHAAIGIFSLFCSSIRYGVGFSRPAS